MPCRLADPSAAPVRWWRLISPRNPGPTSQLYLAVMLIWQALMGVAFLLEVSVVDWSPTLALPDGAFISGMIGGVMLAGSGLALAGLCPRDSASRSWALEFAGHSLLIGALVPYATQVLIEHPAAVVNWSQPTALAVASFFRARQVLRQDRTARAPGGDE